MISTNPNHPIPSPAESSEWARRLRAFINLVPPPNQLGSFGIDDPAELATEEFWSGVRLELRNEAAKFGDYRQHAVVAHWFRSEEGRAPIVQFHFPLADEVTADGGFAAWCEQAFVAGGLTHVAAMLSDSGGTWGVGRIKKPQLPPDAPPPSTLAKLPKPVPVIPNSDSLSIPKSSRHR